MQDQGNAEVAGGVSGRQRRVAAEADDGGRTQAVQQAPGLNVAGQHSRRADRLAQRVAGNRRGGNPVDLGARHVAEAAAAGIGDQRHAVALGGQCPCQRLGREEVPAGAAGGQDDQLVVGGLAHRIPPHVGSPGSTRRRVRASTIPIVSPSARSEEPP